MFKLKLKIALLGAILLFAPQSYAQTADSVDLLWQAETYTPPFYAGRALPSSHSLVRVVAIPNFVSGGRRLAEADLVYDWQKDFLNIHSTSGRGKNIMTYRAGQRGSSNTIRVEVSTPDRTRRAEAILVLPVKEPEIIFYGLRESGTVNYATALTSPLLLPGKEYTLLAAPYFFSLAELAAKQVPPIWSHGGGLINPSEANPWQLTLLTPSNISVDGSDTISLAARNNLYPLQQASGSLKVNYGASSGSTF